MSSEQSDLEEGDRLPQRCQKEGQQGVIEAAAETREERKRKVGAAPTGSRCWVPPHPWALYVIATAPGPTGP